MTPFADLVAQGAGRAWFFIPSAILLGALHGLEPGHSKTMMAAFIVAIRGTVRQAVLLGLAATVSHTVVVWAIALGGMWLYQGLDVEAVEPYFQLLSGAIIIALALWMIARTWAGRRATVAKNDSTGDGTGGRSALPPDAPRIIDTGHGRVALAITAGAAHWHLRVLGGQFWAAQDVTLEIGRPDGSRQLFAFVPAADGLISADPIRGPHRFTARLRLSHGNHGHDYDLDYPGAAGAAFDLADDGHQDAHARAHANDIRRRFAGQEVTTWQIALFGITGGLLPCPAAITVLLICLQLKEIPLGAVLVLCFSVGLALTLVTVGAVAAVGSRKARGRWPWLSGIAARAPYLSGALIILVGVYVGWHGAMALAA